MEYTNIKEELKYFNENYNIENVLSIPLILNQICQFLNKDNIKLLSLCNKNIYLLYCNQIKKLKVNKEAHIYNLQKIIDKYDNINNLDLRYCENIKDFSPISKLESLENLDISNTNISDISFLEKNKNIKELYLISCYHIKDYSHISNLEKLERLDLSYCHISDISFLEKNKNIKELKLVHCTEINNFSSLYKLKKIEILNANNTEISDNDASLIKKSNKNIRHLARRKYYDSYDD